MKELFASLPVYTKADWLVDTCFLYWVFTQQKEKEFVEFCATNVVALSSFTVEEVLFHAHDVPHQFRERFRVVVKEGLQLGVVAVPVHPGNPADEVTYVNSIDAELTHLVPDHSDAVIAALAMKIHSNILTRDKHHLFTVVLENYFATKNLRIENNL